MQNDNCALYYVDTHTLWKAYLVHTTQIPSEGLASKCTVQISLPFFRIFKEKLLQIHSYDPMRGHPY